MSFIEVEKSIKNEEWSMIDLHSHSHYEIYFLQKGKRTFFLSNALYRLEAPVLIIIPPHVLHKTEGGAFSRFNVNVSDDYLDDFQKHVLQDKALTIFKLNDEKTCLFEDIFEQMNNLNKLEKFSSFILKTLFSYMVLQINELFVSTQHLSVNQEKFVPPQILKVIDFLNVNFAKNLTLTNISKKFFISKNTLIYNFNKYIKCSPVEYVLNLRIVKAKELLERTNKSVNEISEICGFSSANYFGLIFKKIEKISPLAYRKHQKNKV